MILEYVVLIQVLKGHVLLSTKKISQIRASRSRYLIITEYQEKTSAVMTVKSILSYSFNTCFQFTQNNECDEV